MPQQRDEKRENTKEESMLNRRLVLQWMGGVAAVAGVGPVTPVLAADRLRIAMVVKALGIGFFDACRDGGQEAAKELGNVDLIYTGPTKTTAEEQIAVIDALIAQKVDAIAISANDPNALVPVCKKAMSRGIKVISFDSGVAPEGRIMHLNPSNNALIGSKCVQMMAKTIKSEGEFAILSATAQATNQNIWIEEMKKELAKPDYARMKLVSTVYGDDVADKSYRETQGLLKANPNLKGIIAPTSVGIVAAAKAVVDAGLVGKVYVTGLGLPSEMKGAVLAGATDTFAIWNPIDLGYSATMIAAAIASGKATGAPNSTIHAGRMGDIKIAGDGSAAMADPFTFDKSNIEQFAKIF
jgi:rhamnose transport system substrate-binding protein